MRENLSRSAIVEVIPVGYVDYSFELLSEQCKVSYYALHSKISEGTFNSYSASKHGG